MATALFVQLGPFFYGGALATAPKLYHYAAGSTTDKDIWSDRGEGTPLAQPFVGDAEGVFNFFGDGIYKLVIKTSAGDTLYTLDNVLIQDATALLTLAEGAAITSASTTVLGSEVWAHVTGTVTINALSGTIALFWAVFDGALTLTHSSNLVLFNGVNRKTNPGDAILFLNDGGGIWRQASECPAAKQTDIASASSITPPPNQSFVDITGTTTITALATINSGHTFRGRFTGAGLNITYNGTSLITPWARDYRTVPNEILEFVSLGSGNWIVYSLNGPKERVGVTIEANTTTLPAGYLEEDGTAVSRTTYKGLFDEIGTTFGVGDGSTTFNVPLTAGLVAINRDAANSIITSASTNGANAATLGGKGGAQTHTLVTAEMPAHTHDELGTPVAAGADDTNATSTATNADSATTSVTGSKGGGGAHSNTQPWIAKKKFIRF